MKKEVFENVLVGYNEYDKEVKDEQGNLLYTEHIKKPIYEQKISYVDYTIDEILDILRSRRQFECFQIINRSILWYNSLNDIQQAELKKWYENWLDVPQLYKKNNPSNIEDIIPNKPKWLK